MRSEEPYLVLVRSAYKDVPAESPCSSIGEAQCMAMNVRGAMHYVVLEPGAGHRLVQSGVVEDGRAEAVS